MIRDAENYLKNRFGFNQLRVRYHEERLARIELPPNKIQKVLNHKNLMEIRDKLKDLGFVYITIDIEGFRSGSLNEILNN